MKRPHTCSFLAAAALSVAATALSAATDANHPGVVSEPAGVKLTGEDIAALKPGRTFILSGSPVNVKVMNVPRLVTNEFSRRYCFDCFGDETLAKLRKQEKLDAVVKDANSEFDRMVRLMDWAYKRIKLFGPPASRPGDPLKLLKAVDAGEGFNCGYYAMLLRQALRSMGYVARSLGLKGAKGDGNGSEHGVVEVWSNEHRKWVVLDPTLNVYFTRKDVPLNGYEVRREWFYNDGGKDLTIVIGAAGAKHTVKDLPIARGTHPGFGTLRLRPESIGKFLYLAYTPTTAEGKPDYGRMFITKDKLCEGVPYHTRICPKDPARDPYWPMQQAALTLTAGEGATINAKAETMTPDFAKFQHRIDGGKWKDGAPSDWGLNNGDNTLEVRAVNKFGVEGAVSKVVLQME